MHGQSPLLSPSLTEKHIYDYLLETNTFGSSNSYSQLNLRRLHASQGTFPLHLILCRRQRMQLHQNQLSLERENHGNDPTHWSSVSSSPVLLLDSLYLGVDTHNIIDLPCRGETLSSASSGLKGQWSISAHPMFRLCSSPAIISLHQVWCCSVIV